MYICVYIYIYICTRTYVLSFHICSCIYICKVARMPRIMQQVSWGREGGGVFANILFDAHRPVPCVGPSPMLGLGSGS